MGIVSAMMQVGAAIKHAVAALFKVTHSLRFDGTSDHMTRTFGTPTDNTTWTLSFWFKRSRKDIREMLFTTPGGTSQLYFDFLADNTMHVNDYVNSSSGSNFKLVTAQTFTDNDWHHAVLMLDGSGTGGPATKSKLFVDGVDLANEVPSGLSTHTHANISSFWNSNNVVHYIGQYYTGANWFDGQLAEVHFVDGTAYDASYFGETRGGQWVPKEVTGVTYGNNGFYLPFDRREEGVTLLLDGSGGGTSTITDNSSANNDMTNVSSGVSNPSPAITGPYGTTQDVLEFDGNNDYLNAGNVDALGLADGDWTIECWVKPGELADYQVISSYGGGVASWSDPQGQQWVLMFGSSDAYFQYYNGSNNTNVFGNHGMSTTSWHHLAATRAGNTIKLFIDGSQIASSTVSPAATTQPDKLVIGVTPTLGSPFEGYIADFRITRGIARDIAAGFSNGTPISGGGWDVSLTNDIQYGSLGRDATTNGNDFTVNGAITPDDQLIDSPNLRFATLDPDNLYHYSGTGTLSEANLKFEAPTVSYQGSAMGTLGKSSGKWYCEILAAGTDPGIGLYDGDFSATDLSYENYSGQPNKRISINGPGRLLALGTQNRYRWKYPSPVPSNGSGNQYDANASCSPASFSHSGWTAGTTVIGMAIDLDVGDLEIFFDGVSQGVAFDDLSGGPWHVSVCDWKTSESNASVFTINFGQDHTFSGALAPLSSPYDDGDNGEFRYQPPSGFKALATSY